MVQKTKVLGNQQKCRAILSNLDICTGIDRGTLGASGTVGSIPLHGWSRVCRAYEFCGVAAAISDLCS